MRNLTEAECRVLPEVIDYHPDTGKIFWKKRDVSLFPNEHRAKIWNTRFAGKEAFCKADRDGYFIGHVFTKPIRAHHVAWFMYYGEWPKQVIDHINGIPSDNRIENLRDVSQEENHRNKKMYRTNTSGVPGVFWHAPNKKWCAQIWFSRKNKHLGYFDSIEEAAEARKTAAREHGYHSNHGRAA